MLTDEERAELDALVAAQATDLEWLSSVERMYPLATSCLWTNSEAACDQRRAVVGVMRAPIVGIVLGGWRSGKSEGLKQLTVASAMGGGHPAVQQWLAINGLPEDVIPEAPAQVYAIAQSSSDSRRYHRDDFERIVGRGIGHWSGRNAQGEASLTIPVPGTAVPGKIWFKSVDQTRRSFQGISIRYAWIDEEPLGEVGYGVYDELRARVADQDGRIGISMIPLEGYTWVHDKLVRDREDDARIFELDTLDNPHLPRRSFERLFGGMGEDEVAQRRYGRFRSRSGLVYPQWTEGDGDRWGPGHLCDPFEIPADWPRFRGADFGITAPTGVVWGALGDDYTLYLYREYYQPDGESYEWHAGNVAAAEGRVEIDGEWVCGDDSESIEAGWGDPSAPAGINAFCAAGVFVGKADNDVRGGIDSLKDRMRLRADGRPRLKVFRTLTHFCQEMRGYVWDPKRNNEVPVKKNDHLLDAARYLSRGVDAWLGL